MKTGLIYKITHKKSGKSYIGLTTRSFKERMNEYKYHYGNPKYFQNSAIYQALRSDGWDAFTREVIEENIADSELDAKEIFYIDRYNSQVPNGYNILEGGRIEAVRKMGKSNAKPVYRIDPDTCDIIDYAPSMYVMSQRVGTSPISISTICYGSNSSGKPRYVSKGYTYRLVEDYDREEVIQKMSERNIKKAKSLIGYYLDRNEPIGVDGSIVLNNGSEIIGKYSSAYEASLILNISSGNISDYCRGKRSFAAKLYPKTHAEEGRKIGFAYLNDKSGNLDAINSRKSKLHSQKNQEIYLFPVELYNKDTGESIEAFRNYEEAKEKFNLSKAKYKKCVSQKTTFGVRDGIKLGWRLL